MAPRESQGMQVALILFALLTVALGVATYVYWKKADDLVRQRRQADEERLASQTELATLRQDQMRLKQLLGYAPDVRQADIEANFQPEMALFAATYQAERNYRGLAPFLVDEVVKSKAQYLDSEAQRAQLTTMVAQVRTQEAGLAQAARAATQASQAELARRQAEFGAERTRITADQKLLADKLDEQLKKAALDQADSQKKLAEAGTRVRNLEQLVEKLRDEIKALRGTSLTEKADGRITLVEQGPRIVRINLGEADGLRRLMTFTVVDRDAGNVNTARPKGKIEITKLIEPHQAEARIVEDDLRDPILTDDQIFTPAWAPGQKLRFALVGFMDLDGDGRSDRAKIKSMIALYGGEVVAEGTDEGKRIGKLDIDTRYLIVGDRPTDKTRPELIQTYTSMTTEARQLAIEQLSVQRLLGLIGK